MHTSADGMRKDVAREGPPTPPIDIAAANVWRRRRRRPDPPSPITPPLTCQLSSSVDLDGFKLDAFADSGPAGSMLTLPPSHWRGEAKTELDDDDVDESAAAAGVSNRHETLASSPPRAEKVILSASLSPSRTGGAAWRNAFVARSVGPSRKIDFLYGSARPEIERVARAAVAAMDRRIKPTLVEDGLGGTYFIRGSSCSDGTGGGTENEHCVEKTPCIAVFKPRDEEPMAPNNPKVHSGSAMGAPGMKAGVLVGEAAVNEYAAYLVDVGSPAELVAGVCATALVRFAHSMFFAANEEAEAGGGCMFRQVKDKVGSFQLFAEHDCTAEDLGPSKYSIDSVHRIAVLDIRICNTDRHMGNILCRVQPNAEPPVLIPIDHGYALPDEVGDWCGDWMDWPQCKQPFSDAMVAAIRSIDIEAEAERLRVRLPAIRTECLATIRVCTMLLKEAASAGLNAHQIATLMTRPYVRRGEMPQLSELEKVIAQAKTTALRATYYTKQKPHHRANAEDTRRELYNKVYNTCIHKLIRARVAMTVQ